tara:strand:+ start:809 stop:1513 length:705 start_codon:yes stop_codon:yes gene_type:complete
MATIMKHLILVFCSFLFSGAFSQEDMKHSYLVGAYNISNHSTHGISFGVYNKPDLENSITNGIRFELVGKGIHTWFVDEYVSLDIDTIQINKEYSEKINGISFSFLGVYGDQRINGIHFGGMIGNKFSKNNGLMISGGLNIGDVQNGLSVACFGNKYEIQNGISIGFAGNIAHRANGVHIAVFSNKARFFYGLQFGLLNWANSGKLIQIGLLNVIESNPRWCRTLPVFNIRLRK